MLKLLFIKPDHDIINQLLDVPLGILYLSSYLKKNLNQKIDIHFLDLRLVKNKNEALVSKLKEYSPDIIGISLLAFEKSCLPDLVNIIHEHSPDSKIVMGGPYPTYYYEEILTKDYADLVIIGEGEQVLLNLVDCWIEGRDIRDIKGIAYNDAGSVICNDKEAFIEDLDSIPFPDYTLIDIKSYWGYHKHMNGILAAKTYTHIMSSRACPYKCIFCHNMFGKKLRKRSPENFVDEIVMLHDQYGVKEFHIVDDAFNVDRKRMHEILNRIIEKGLKIKIAFPNALKGDLLTQEDILLLKNAGTYMITFAIETASERIQKQIRKNLDIQKIVQNIEFASKIGLVTKGYFMLGFPGESISELKSTVDLAINSKLDLAAFWAVVPFEKTDLRSLAEDLYSDFDFSAIEVDDYFCKKSFYEQVTGFNLNLFHISANLSFFSLKRLVKLFLKVERKGYVFMRCLKSGWMILKG